MASYQLPGVLCRALGAFKIDEGTLCRAASTAPGPTGSEAAESGKKRRVRRLRVYAEHRGAVKNPMDYDGKPVYRNDAQRAECAVLVRRLALAPPSKPDNITPDGWQRGMGLTESNVGALEIGTPIATGWNALGFYPDHTHGQHSGIFAGPVIEKGKIVGFTIVEQYDGRIQITHRTVYFDPVAHGYPEDYFHRGKDYATIKW
jgi:hypothetical protein